MTIFDVRPEAGVQRAPEDDGWVAASHAAVQTVLREPGWSSDHRNAARLVGLRADGSIPDIAGDWQKAPLPGQSSTHAAE